MSTARAPSHRRPKVTLRRTGGRGRDRAAELGGEAPRAGAAPSSSRGARARAGARAAAQRRRVLPADAARGYVVVPPAADAPTGARPRPRRASARCSAAPTRPPPRSRSRTGRTWRGRSRPRPTSRPPAPTSVVLAAAARRAAAAVVARRGARAAHARGVPAGPLRRRGRTRAARARARAGAGRRPARAAGAAAPPSSARHPCADGACAVAAGPRAWRAGAGVAARLLLGAPSGWRSARAAACRGSVAALRLLARASRRSPGRRPRTGRVARSPARRRPFTRVLVVVGRARPCTPVGRNDAATLGGGRASEGEARRHRSRDPRPAPSRGRRCSGTHFLRRGTAAASAATGMPAASGSSTAAGAPAGATASGLMERSVLQHLQVGPGEQMTHMGRSVSIMGTSGEHGRAAVAAEDAALLLASRRRHAVGVPVAERPAAAGVAHEPVLLLAEGFGLVGDQLAGRLAAAALREAVEAAGPAGHRYARVDADADVVVRPAADVGRARAAGRGARVKIGVAEEARRAHEVIALVRRDLHHALALAFALAHGAFVFCCWGCALSAGGEPTRTPVSCKS